MKGPPSSGQHVSAGSRSSLTSCVTRSVTGPVPWPASADLEQFHPYVARTPQLCGGGRHDCLDELDDASNQTERALTERHLGAASRAEQVGDESKSRTLDVGEEERGSAAGNDAPMNLCDLEMGIDLGLHRDEVPVTAKLVEKSAEVWEHEVAGPLSTVLSPR